MDAEKEMEERKEKEKDEEANINFLKESIGSKVCTFLKVIFQASIFYFIFGT